MDVWMGFGWDSNVDYISVVILPVNNDQVGSKISGWYVVLYGLQFLHISSQGSNRFDDTLRCVFQYDSSVFGPYSEVDVVDVFLGRVFVCFNIK